jgi:hypothetical protein
VGFYSLSRSNIALSTTLDTITLIPATGRSIELIEFSIGGIATTASGMVVRIARSSGGTTPSAGVTAQPLREAQAAAGFTNATAWVAQPTLGPELLQIPVNANGGLYRWVVTLETVIIFIDGNTNENLSVRSGVGTAAISFHMIVDEY